MIRRLSPIRLSQDVSALGAALRHGIRRLAAVRRARPVRLALPPVESTADIAAMLDTITTAVRLGGLTPGEAAALSEVADTYIRAFAASEIDRRLRALETRAHAAKS